jgi:hypothetical protein
VSLHFFVEIHFLNFHPRNSVVALLICVRSKKEFPCSPILLSGHRIDNVAHIMSGDVTEDGSIKLASQSVTHTTRKKDCPESHDENSRGGQDHTLFEQQDLSYTDKFCSKQDRRPKES